MLNYSVLIFLFCFFALILFDIYVLKTRRIFNVSEAKYSSSVVANSFKREVVNAIEEVSLTTLVRIRSPTKTQNYGLLNVEPAKIRSPTMVSGFCCREGFARVRSPTTSQTGGIGRSSSAGCNEMS